MAKIRIYRSDMGPICTMGMIAGIGIAIYGLVQSTDKGFLSSEEAVMAFVCGLIFFGLALLSRIVNAPYINQKKEQEKRAQELARAYAAAKEVQARTAASAQAKPKAPAPAPKPLSPEEQLLRHALSQLPPAQDFGGYLDGLKARGLTEEDLKKPEIALREFQQQPSKSFLYYLQLNAPESFRCVLSLFSK